MNITAILSNWTSAAADDRDSVFARLHKELSQIAARQLSGESGADVLLEPGMLVNEAFLKLVDLNAMTWQGRAHFLADRKSVV